MNEKIKYLLYGSNLWYLGEGMLGPFLAVFTEQIGGDILEISWAWSIYLLVSGVLTILLGKISDRINKEKMMILGYAINAFFTFAFILVDAPFKLFIVQAGLGLASALAAPTWNALYAKYEDKGKDGMEWGLADGEAMIVTGIAILIGGIIVSSFNFTALFVVMGVVQVVATVYQAGILRNKKH
ncbi:MAG: MFS transporter [Candidatus Moranbacteria bacterium]|nr:MFS transporter [Candidatus Moranbacteria bacterium]